MSEGPHPWSSELDRFLALALASYLASSAELASAVDNSQADRDDPNAVHRLCEHLMSIGTLTKWQCDKLRNGQYKGFFLGQYKLLEPDPSQAAYIYFADDLELRRRVRLIVKPNPAFPNGIEFRVNE